MRWYLMAFKKCGVFGGRSSRKEYWMYYLCNIIVNIIVMGLIDVFLSGNEILLFGFFLLGTVLPSVALSVRRLHDTDHSAWWLFISLIPLIGNFWFLWLVLLEDSDHMVNRYGPDPTAMNP